MFRWTETTKKMAIGLANSGRFKNTEIAHLLGTDRWRIKLFFDECNIADSFDLVKSKLPVVNDNTESRIANLFFEEGLSRAEITEIVNDSRASLGFVTPLSVYEIYRVILDIEQAAAEQGQDVEVVTQGCDAELAALRAAHPARRYEDALEATEEYKDEPYYIEPVPRRIREIPPYEQTARYKADQAHALPRQITLATHAGEFSRLAA